MAREDFYGDSNSSGVIFVVFKKNIYFLSFINKLRVHFIHFKKKESIELNLCFNFLPLI